MKSKSQISDRRAEWESSPRPSWLDEFNQVAGMMNMKSIVPLTMNSLKSEAIANTGLEDFGSDGWEERFQILLDAVDREAELHPFGRILTRSDFLTYLEARLRVEETYRKHPEIEDEEIIEPVFIIGFGRSGTTILHEVLSQDPQFRSVRRWEALYPCPPPEPATYTSDPRIAAAEKQVEVVHRISPEFRAMHAWGAELPVEDIEFTYSALFSEVWVNAFIIPSYEKYFVSQDPAQHFLWHRRLLKLLQWKYKKPHWLLKNPTHMPRVKNLLKVYPDAKIILPHRDPITTADSVVNISSTIFRWRTDKDIPVDYGDEWMGAKSRAATWDTIIDLVEEGVLHKGNLANLQYAEFIGETRQSLINLYDDLELDLAPDVLESMLDYMQLRSAGSQGNKSRYKKTLEDDPRFAEERRIYRRYQRFFGVPNER